MAGLLLLAPLAPCALADGFAGPFPSWANVKTVYGAKGDGVTDDAPAIQSALNDVTNTGKSSVVYLPPGTYVIKSTLHLNYRYSAAMIGDDPATTKILWEGSAGGEMYVADGATRSHWGRITWDGNGIAGAAFHISWDGHPYYNTTNMQIFDCVFQNVAKGLIGGGPYGNNDAEVGIYRCTFQHCSVAAISLESWNALDYWIWYCTFLDNAIGVTNEFVSGGFHVYNSLFERSSVADITIQNTDAFYGFRGNTSYQSNQFFLAKGIGNNGAAMVFQGNRILDTVNPVAIDIQNFGNAFLVDNQIRSISNQGPAVHMDAQYITGGEMETVGNTFTVPNAVVDDILDPQTWSLDDQVVDPSQIDGSLPVLPGTPPRRTNIFEVPASANTAAIQAVINQAAASGNHPVVHLPQGNYSITTTLTVPPNIDLMLMGDTHHTELDWAGAGAGPVIRLQGPSKAIISDMQIDGTNGETNEDLIEIDDADQPGARVYGESLNMDRFGAYNVLADGLAYTHVDFAGLQHGRASGATASLGVIGIGAPSESRMALYGCTGGVENSSPKTGTLFDIRSGGRLLAEDMWYESSYGPQIVSLGSANSGELTYEGSEMSQVSAGGTTSGAPVVNVNGFDGVATFVNLLGNLAPDPSNNVTVVNEPTTASVLLVGLNANRPAYYTAQSNQGPVSALNFRDNTGAIPDQGTPRTAQMIRKNLNLSRSEAAQPLADTAAGITDVRIYRCIMLDGARGIHIVNSGGTTPPAPQLLPAAPAVPVGQTLQLTSTVPAQWSLAGAGHLVPSGDGKSASYTAPATLTAAHAIAGCPASPDDSVFNVPVDALPLHAENGPWTLPANLGNAPVVVRPTWGISVGDVNTPAIDMKTTNGSQDLGSFLFPQIPQLKREAGDLRSQRDGNNHHVMTIRKTDCTFWESNNDFLGNTVTCPDGSLGCKAQSAAAYPWSNYTLIQGADASGLPLAALTLHLDEIESGAIHHALRLSACPTCVYSGAPLWPSTAQTPTAGCATGTTNAGGNDCSQSPVLGTRYRLKSTFDESSFGAAAQTVLTALKRYGMILADTSIAPGISATDDVTQDPAVRAALDQLNAANLPISDFEAVDESGLMISTSSYEANPASVLEPVTGAAVLTVAPLANGTPVTVPIAIQPVTVGVPSPTLMVMAGMTYPLTAWVNGSTNSGVVWSQVSGAGTVTSLGVYTAPASVAVGTTSSAVLKVAASADPTAFQTVLVTVLSNGAGPAGSIRVDVGAASATTDGNGNVWLPDLGAEAGTWSGGLDVVPWTSAGPYAVQAQSGRVSTGNDAQYAFIVPNGPYKVHFLFGQPESGCAPSCPSTFNPATTRPLNLEVNGVTLQSNYDFGSTIGYHYATLADTTVSAVVSDNHLLVAIRGVLTDAAATGAPSNAASPSLRGLEITPDLSYSYITIDTTTIHTVKAGQTLQFRAIGWNIANTVTWTMTSAAGTGTIGSTTGLYQAPATVAQTFTASIRATSTVDPSRTATASFTVSPLNPAEFSLSTQTVNFGQILSKTVTVTNSGDLTLNWNGVSSVPWLGLSTMTGSLSGNQSAPVVISANTSGLSPAIYNEVVILFAQGVSNSPQFIWVQTIVGNGGASSTLNPAVASVRVYPNPWRSDKHHGRPITFDGLSEGATLKIFTLSGHCVTTLESTGTSVTWNPESADAASGLYLYVVTMNNQASTGKFAIIH